MTLEERIALELKEHLAARGLMETSEEKERFLIGKMDALAANDPSARLDGLYLRLYEETDPEARKKLLAEMIPLCPDDADLRREEASFMPDPKEKLARLLTLREVEKERIAKLIPSLNADDPDGSLAETIETRPYLRLSHAITEEEARAHSFPEAIAEGRRLASIDEKDRFGARETLALLYVAVGEQKSFQTLFPVGSAQGLNALLAEAAFASEKRRPDVIAAQKKILSRNMWFYLFLTGQMPYGAELRAYRAAQPAAEAGTAEEALYAYDEFLGIFGEGFRSLPAFSFLGATAFPIGKMLDFSERIVLALFAEGVKEVTHDGIMGILAGKGDPRLKPYARLRCFGAYPSLPPEMIAKAEAGLSARRLLLPGEIEGTFDPAPCLPLFFACLQAEEKRAA
jgi:hypothetical protein